MSAGGLPLATHPRVRGADVAGPCRVRRVQESCPGTQRGVGADGVLRCERCAHCELRRHWLRVLGHHTAAVRLGLGGVCGNEQPEPRRGRGAVHRAHAQGQVAGPPRMGRWRPGYTQHHVLLCAQDRVSLWSRLRGAVNLPLGPREVRSDVLPQPSSGGGTGGLWLQDEGTGVPRGPRLHVVR